MFFLTIKYFQYYDAKGERNADMTKKRDVVCGDSHVIKKKKVLGWFFICFIWFSDVISPNAVLSGSRPAIRGFGNRGTK